jgi:hypothetical protein
MYSALDAWPSCGASPSSRLLASMTVLPSRPVTPASAAGMSAWRTASRTTSASDASPPSRPSVVT